MKMIPILAAMMLLASQAHGQSLAYAPNRGNVKFLPPAEYDHKYEGRLQVIRGSASLIAHLCPAPSPGYRMTCCAIRMAEGRECLVVLADDDLLLRVGVYDSKIVLRHEIGHCNGWPSHHPDGRPLANFLD